MSDEDQLQPRTPETVAAYQALDAAVMELHRLVEARNPEPPAVATDYVLVVGAMYIDSSGDRNGVVEVFPKDGSQPAYVTTGLLDSALRMVNQ
ncbi:DUF7213 family protein [Mycolicibacterium mucogenicum]|uniref:Uncharacterized protein n=1 Tax=Mycolicibacterium mucogenicum DSM 44124 TaxID=1226753 RepID=A0A8H2JH03_MYCMU|nr:hypothetical protein [Mycolicibacterium mucogenicum]KAB7752773.1 hypothetical protein MMUC44124_26550 [Mycolicibacterium mucogenicum DSM 44124]QPG69103.1 hypothetical protein C1S78_027570 [Mycolicibacterium mucogenicum DSM 44124]